MMRLVMANHVLHNRDMANNYPVLSVRLNPEDKKALQELAHHKRLTVSELVLKSLKPSIRKGQELL